MLAGTPFCEDVPFVVELRVAAGLVDSYTVSVVVSRYCALMFFIPKKNV